jgi:hypothetical protein
MSTYFFPHFVLYEQHTGGPCTIKLFTLVIIDAILKARVFFKC